MSAQLSVTIELEDCYWVISASLKEGGDLPEAIFLYANTGKAQLGDYSGVVTIDELTKTQEFTGTAIPVFGNRFVRTKTARIVVGSGEDAPLIAKRLVDNVKVFGNAYRSFVGNTSIYSV